MDNIGQNIQEYIKNNGPSFLETLRDILIITIVFYIITKIINIAIKKGLKRVMYTSSKARVNTVATNLQNAVKYIMVVLFFLTVLIISGFDFQVLIAGAGVGTVVLGIAGRELIADFLSGLFIIIEHYYDVGDYVEISEYEGYVVALGAKSTTLETYSGEIVSIPNSKIEKVKNYSKSKYILYYDIEIAYESSLEKVEAILEKYVQKKASQEEMINKISYLGVDTLAESGIKLRLSIETEAENRFAVRRLLNRDLKLLFDENQIEIPYQKVEVYGR